jgi:lysophospholipase L1-like esterase
MIYGLQRMHPLLGKTSATLVVMLAALAVPYASPKMRAFRVVQAPWEKEDAREAANDAPPVVAAPPPSASVGEQALAASKNEATVTNALPATHSGENDQAIDPAIAAKLGGTVAIEDPTGHALDAFYESLSKTEKARAAGVTGADSPVTRILHYGDSVIASDYISGTARRRMQERFGDAGHGFILIANPWQWYFHNDVVHHNSDGWNAARLAGPIAMDGVYGLGGVSFQSYGGGLATFGTMDKGDYGKQVSRFDIYYWSQPGGGDLEIKLKGGSSEKLSTAGEKKESKIYSVKVADGAAQMSIRALSNVRLFGVSLERDVPGVQYDALGSHAAMAVYWLREDDQNWKEQMALRKPSLVILQYGTNESDLWKIDWDEYEKNLGLVFDKVKNAAAGASILVMAPMDRAETGPGGGLRTKAVILRLRETQKRVALAKSLAFWDTFAAMGGEGSMARWVKSEPKLGGGDLTHPTPAGSEVLGDLLTKAIVTGYEAWGGAHR